MKGSTYFVSQAPVEPLPVEGFRNETPALQGGQELDHVQVGDLNLAMFVHGQIFLGRAYALCSHKTGKLKIQLSPTSKS